MFLESTTNKIILHMNSTPTGKMDSLTICVPFLMTLHSKTNAMPKCCCDSNFVLLFIIMFQILLIYFDKVLLNAYLIHNNNNNVW